MSKSSGLGTLTNQAMLHVLGLLPISTFSLRSHEIIRKVTYLLPSMSWEMTKGDWHQQRYPTTEPAATPHSIIPRGQQSDPADPNKVF